MRQKLYMKYTGIMYYIMQGCTFNSLIQSIHILSLPPSLPPSLRPALGHPLGTSGSRITGHLVHELRRRGLRRAVGSACVGGGQGIALLLERMD